MDVEVEVEEEGEEKEEEEVEMEVPNSGDPRHRAVDTWLATSDPNEHPTATLQPPSTLHPPTVQPPRSWLRVSSVPFRKCELHIFHFCV